MHNTNTNNNKNTPHQGYILTISCPDRPGIVYAISQFLLEVGANILDSAQFSDVFTNRCFMRVHFVEIAPKVALHSLENQFIPIANKFLMQANFYEAEKKPRVLVMVSKFGHCLNDLLFRSQSGNLPIEIVGIGSNHLDFEELAKSYKVPFHYFSITSLNDTNKLEQEKQLLKLIDRENIDLVVLARYMQILSSSLCEKLEGKVINIHHSFLPSFKGAKPYLQAHQRGVKLIGATAHYVTMDLDEGPIIEQEVRRVNHAMNPDELASAGRDAECMALARAVQWHAEHRILLNGKSTIVF